MEDFRSIFAKGKTIEKCQQRLEWMKKFTNAFRTFSKQFESRGRDFMIEVVFSGGSALEFKLFDQYRFKITCRMVDMKNDRYQAQMVLFWMNPDEPVFITVMHIDENGGIRRDGIGIDIDDIFLLLHNKFDHIFEDYKS